MSNISPTELDSTGRTTSKIVYSAPFLKVFGSVSALTMGTAGTSCDGSNSGSNSPKTGSPAVCTSDPSAKENIARIGTHPMGFGMYLFDYKPEFRAAWGYGRQFGVMADEVKSVLQDAVVTHPDGYMMVDYALLGISRAIH